MKYIIIGIAVLNFFAFVDSAWGIPPINHKDLARAKEAWRVGRALYKKGDYQAAKKQFAVGHRITNKGGFLFNMAECARMLGEKQAAKKLYQRYLKTYPQGNYRERALEKCQALHFGHCLEKKTPKKNSAEKSSPSALSLTKKKMKAKTTGGALQVAHPILVNDPTARDVFVQKQSKPPSKKPFYRHWGFWTGVGIAVVGGSITAIILATRSNNDSLPPADYVINYQ